MGGNTFIIIILDRRHLIAYMNKFKNAKKWQNGMKRMLNKMFM